MFSRERFPLSTLFLFSYFPMMEWIPIFLIFTTRVDLKQHPLLEDEGVKKDPCAKKRKFKSTFSGLF